MRRAFTLAEVLITLGILGVVAALTMPSLVGNYKKSVLETRIKKFYSVINQAVNANIAENSVVDVTMLTTAYDPYVIEEFFNVNYKPYMRTVAVKKLTKGLAVALADGSGMYFVKTSAEAVNYKTTGCTYILWCVDYKKCEKLDESQTVPLNLAVDGKDSFLFWTNGQNELAFAKNQDRDLLLSSCGGSEKHMCSALLMYDGWKVKDDYPVKF